MLLHYDIQIREWQLLPNTENHIGEWITVAKPKNKRQAIVYFNSYVKTNGWSCDVQLVEVRDKPLSAALAKRFPPLAKYHKHKWVIPCPCAPPKHEDD